MNIMAAPEPAVAESLGGQGHLELDQVSKSYGHEHALLPTSFQVRNGEFVTILGPSGSGKTTILRLIGGFTQTSSGRILVDGKDITRLPPNRRPCNTVFQDYALFPHKSAAGNVGYGLMVRKVAKAEALRRVDEALQLVGLETMGQKFPSQLSGGQQQRVALARSLVCQPRVLLLDEPLSALDADMRRQMQQFLKRVQREIQTTFVFVTHDQEEAISLSDRIVVMSKGKVEQIASPYEIYYRPETHFVATFLGDNNLMDGTVRDGGGVDLPIGPVACATDGRGKGEKVYAAIRPERIGLARTIEAGKTGIECSVAEIGFAGAMTTVRVRPNSMPDLSLLVKVTSGRWIEDLTAGASVFATFDPADISVFSRTAP